MGASVPSTSRSTAVRAGSARSGASGSASVAAVVTASSMPRVTRGRWLELGAIGTAAGVFSGLFGVGGGSIMVPLLVLWLGYGTREATGTSLAAIVVIAAIAAAVQAGYGNVDVGQAAAIGLPAVAGVVAGTWLQQRVSTKAVTLAFSALLVVIAIQLVVR